MEESKERKMGYSPVCRNEWVRGICGKPQVKCGECPNQAFVPFGDDIIRSHLIGRVTGNAWAISSPVSIPCGRTKPAGS